MLTGNREFNESYENYKNLILRTAYTYSGNREAAEDITQETFLKLYIGYDSMKKENIPSWLYTTAKNMALNYKKKAKWEVLAMDDDESAVPEPGTKSTEDEYLEDELKRKRNVLHKKISEEMYKKNPRWYEAMVLVYYMDMPQVKAAELMGINLRTLHSLLHRAKNWIKKNYKAECEEMNRED